MNPGMRMKVRAGQHSDGDSVRRHVFVQVGRTMGANALIAASKFAALPILTYTLAPAEFGVYALILAITSFGEVLLGIGVQYTYRTVPGKTANEAGRLMNTTMLFDLSLAAALVGVLYVSGAASALLAVLNVGAYGQVFVLAAFWMLVDLLAASLRSFLFARQRMGHANLVDLFRQVLWLPLLIVLWLGRGHVELEIVIACALLGSAAGVAYGGITAGSSVHHGVDFSLLASALRFSMPLFIPAAVVPLMRLADRSIISASRSLEEVAAYSVLTALASGLYACSALSVEMALLPRAVRAANVGDLRGSRSILWTSVTYGGWTFALGAAATWLAAFALLSSQSIYPEYASAFGLFPVVLLGYLLMILTRAAHNALMIANRTGVIFVIDFLTLLIAVSLDLLLIPPFGMAGAALATIVAFGMGGALKLLIGGVWRDLTWWGLIVPRTSALTAEERDVT